MLSEKWNRRFLELAAHIASWSRDPSTKTGAVIVRPNKSVAGVGFNGFPQGAKDDPELYTDRTYKYDHIVHCVIPSHKTLTSDLRWVELGETKVGNSLVGFDEYPVTRSGRKYRKAIVEHVEFSKEPAFRVIFNDGTEIFTTAGHRWLLGIRSNNVRRWRRTDELIAAPKNGKLTATGLPHHASKIYKLFTPWIPATDYDAGYLAGLLDGEGSVSKQNYTLQFAQRPGVVLDKALDLLTKRAQEFHIWSHSSPMQGGLGKKDCIAAHIRGKLSDRLAFLGTIRPERLLGKLNPDMFGRMHSPQHRIRCVIAIEQAGIKEIIKVQTSTHTMIVEGFPMHNCEINALLFANGPVNGCTLYTWPFISCIRCAVQMAQAGIFHFVAPNPSADALTRWAASFNATRKFLGECNLGLTEIGMAEDYLRRH